MKILIFDTGDDNAARVSATLFEENFLRETGIAVQYKEIRRSEHGKPLPIAQWHYNLSHSGHFWTMALNKNTEVGVDIEMRRVLRDRMERRVLACNEEALNGELLRSWVLKEAYAKKLGLGLSLDFRTFTVNDVFKRCAVVDYSTDQYFCYTVY